MTLKEPESTRSLDVHLISPKTSHEELKGFSEKGWPTDGRRRVAANMVKNGKELLAGSNIDWDLVLGSMRVQHRSTLQVGEAALAVYDAPMVGGFAAGGGWAMHNPPIVYLSVKCLTNRATLENFKSTAQETVVVYGQNVFPNAGLYIATLDFLLEIRDRNRYRHILNKLVFLLGGGDIEGAYKIMSSRADLVRTRG